MENKKGIHGIKSLLVFVAVFFLNTKVITALFSIIMSSILGLLERLCIGWFPSVGYIFGEETLLQVMTTLVQIVSMEAYGALVNMHVVMLGFLLLQYIGMCSLLGIPLLYSLWFAEDDRWERVFRKPVFSFKGGILLFLLIVVTLPFFLLLTLWIYYLLLNALGFEFPSVDELMTTSIEGDDEIGNNIYATFGVIKSVPHLLLNIFVLALLPALVEEVLFRGFLQVIMGRVIKNHHVTIFLTGFLFSLFHWDLLGFLPRTLLGMFLGYLYRWTGSFAYPVMAHFLNNSFVFIFQYWVTSSASTGSYVTLQHALQGDRFMVVIFTLGCVCIFLCRKIRAMHEGGNRGKSYPIHNF